MWSESAWVKHILVIVLHLSINNQRTSVFCESLILLVKFPAVTLPLSYYCFLPSLEAARAGSYEDYLLLPHLGEARGPVSGGGPQEHPAGDTQWRSSGSANGADCRLPLPVQPQVVLLRLQTSHQVRRLPPLGELLLSWFQLILVAMHLKFKVIYYTDVMWW